MFYCAACFLFLCLIRPDASPFLSYSLFKKNYPKKQITNVDINCVVYVLHNIYIIAHYKERPN